MSANSLSYRRGRGRDTRRTAMAGGVALALTCLAPDVARAVPQFTVFAGPGNTSSCDGKTAIISGALAPASVSHSCADKYGTAAAAAQAGFGAVGVMAEATTITNFSVPREDLAMATFTDTLVFSKLSPQLPNSFVASVNLRFDDTLVNAGATAGWVASAQALLSVNFAGLHQLHYVYRTDQGCNVFNTGGFSGVRAFTGPCGLLGSDTMTVTTAPRIIAVGAQAFTMRLDARAGSAGVAGSAIADWLHTVQFPTDSDVFNLPAGYTVNAGSYLVNNRFIDPNAPRDIPEPPPLAVFAMAVLGSAAFGWRPARRLAGLA